MNDFEIQIRYRKKARRATLRVLPGKIIRVIAPFRTGREELFSFVMSNSDWILEKNKILEATPLPKIFKFENGEIFRYLGDEYILKIVSGRGEVELCDNSIQVSVPMLIIDKPRYIKRQLIKWFQIRALERIQIKVAKYTNQVNAKEKSITLKSYKSRWGCCSVKGDLVFNWQIISFKEDLFNYVVAHEVCHLKEMNHGVRFYELLQKLGFEKNKYHAMMRTAQNLFAR